LILGAIKLVNKEIRPYALSVIESFGLPDHMIQSAIGNSYGDIYETHLKWAKESRLNNTVDNIPEGYLEYITPILKAKL